MNLCFWKKEIQKEVERTPDEIARDKEMAQRMAAYRQAQGDMVMSLRLRDLSALAAFTAALNRGDSFEKAAEDAWRAADIFMEAKKS